MDDFDKFLADLKKELGDPEPLPLTPSPVHSSAPTRRPAPAREPAPTQRPAPAREPAPVQRPLPAREPAPVRKKAPAQRSAPAADLPSRKPARTAGRTSPPAPVPDRTPRISSEKKHLYDFWWVFVIVAVIAVAGSLIGTHLLFGRSAPTAAAPMPQAAAEAAPTRTGGQSDTSSANTDEAPDAGRSPDIVADVSGDVTVTVPADIVGDVTQAELDETAAEKGFRSIVLNSDGSATYTMTQAQHQQMLAELRKTIDDSLSDLLVSEEFPHLMSIAPNEDYTNFIITIDGSELTLQESMSVISFYSIGEMYTAFAGTPAENVHVIFKNLSGDIISEGNSRDMGQ